MVSSREGQPSEQPAFSSKKGAGGMVSSASTSAFYFNGLLENYQQKVNSAFHDNPLRSANAVVTGSLSTFRSIGTVY
jgi:hypothetical protein